MYILKGDSKLSVRTSLSSGAGRGPSLAFGKRTAEVAANSLGTCYRLMDEQRDNGAIAVYHPWGEG